MTVNSDYPETETTEIRRSYAPSADPTVVRRTVVRESNTGWWLAAAVAIVAILAVVFLVTRSPTRTDDQVQAAIDQARTQAALDAQNNAAAQSAAAQSAAMQSSLAQSAQAAQLAAQQDAANRTAQAALDAQARAESAARQASMAATAAAQRAAAERANDATVFIAPAPEPGSASSTQP